MTSPSVQALFSLDNWSH